MKILINKALGWLIKLLPEKTKGYMQNSLSVKADRENGEITYQIKLNNIV